jgi:ATP-dependent DNA helicase DinG
MARHVAPLPASEALAKVTASLPGGGEQRPGQVAMAEAVEEAFAEHRHLLVAAGTGTGKSLAYLVPSAQLGRPVVVATATKALQEQLAQRDLPLVAEVLGDVVVAVLKGRNNYLCRQRAAELAERGFQAAMVDEVAGEPADDRRLVAQVERLLAFERSSASGDRAELAEDISERAWSMVSVGPRECPGAYNCPQGARCFTELARAHAAEADIVVINLHLLGAHLAAGGLVLPEHDALVIDEVHELEAVMTQSLGVELGPTRLRTLASQARALLSSDGAEAPRRLAELGESLSILLSELAENSELDLADHEALAEVLSQLDEALRSLLAALRGLDEDEAGGPRAVSSATRLLEDVGRLRGAGDDEVLWLDGSRASRSLSLSPIDVGPALVQGLFSTSTVVMTSATVPTGLGTRLGLEPAELVELDVGSPFDFRSNSMLYVALDVGDRKAPEAELRIADELGQLIDAAGGRTLALFTSRRAMREAADRVADRVAHPILVQGAATNRALIERFRDEEDACLFATMGMWQGLDVPGRSLSLVTIDRLPFGRPDDPLLEARRRRAGSQAFRLVDLPRAATLLAQGVGRLIRSTTDRGVVAVMDPRLATAGYRQVLLGALPPMRRTIDRDEVLGFLAEITASAEA